jgi:hypothetical protein
MLQIEQRERARFFCSRKGLSLDLRKRKVLTVRKYSTVGTDLDIDGHGLLCLRVDSHSVVMGLENIAL